MTQTAYSQAVFGEAVSKGVLAKAPINEASGLVASRENPGFLWTHNDSGDEARVFLIDTLARLYATYYFQDIEARDWEEIAWMQVGDRNFLIIGDIGDNRGVRSEVSVHIIPEPVFRRQGSPADTIPATVIDTIPATSIRTYTLQYEDGPRDAEAMFYDPQDDLLYVITKRELHVGLYAAAIPSPIETASFLSSLHPDKLPVPLRLERKATLPFTFITAADISPSGEEILIKNLLSVYHWKRRAGESVVQTLSREAETQPYQPEPQGEAIAFSLDACGYYTLSEQVLGLPVHLLYVQRVRN